MDAEKYEKQCPVWASSGECKAFNSIQFMSSQCAKSCEVCIGKILSFPILSTYLGCSNRGSQAQTPESLFLIAS